VYELHSLLDNDQFELDKLHSLLDNDQFELDKLHSPLHTDHFDRHCLQFDLDSGCFALYKREFLRANEKLFSTRFSARVRQ
jgi:hypothetical protein